MSALPILIETKRELPDYLPARMVNEFAYCPRLFFYEWGRRAVRRERRYSRGLDPTRPGRCQSDGAARRLRTAAVDPLTQRDPIQ